MQGDTRGVERCWNVEGMWTLTELRPHSVDYEVMGHCFR